MKKKAPRRPAHSRPTLTTTPAKATSIPSVRTALPRQYYLDNLRWAISLWLIPTHTFFFYVQARSGNSSMFVLSNLASLPLWMPLLLIIAGMSTVFSLKKRTLGVYLRERAQKLLLPFVATYVCVIPLSMYCLARTRGYTDGFGHFLFSLSTLWGYIQNFPLLHLWFLAALIICSVTIAPLYKLYEQKVLLPKQSERKPLPYPALFLLFLLPLLASGRLQIFESFLSVGESLVWFSLGLFVLSNPATLARMEKHRWILLGVAVVAAVLSYSSLYAMLDFPPPFDRLFTFLHEWTAVLALLALGKRFWNGRGKWSGYLQDSSFAFYLFHFLFVFVAGLLSVRLIPDNIWLSCLLTIALAYPLTFLFYEIVRRIPGLRFLFAIKPQS
ncbi:MAG: acyltransferase family protein [Oscillospiraceae bacterium]|jgi:hypothetical protein|nr:acyltransferase family protein [Oscillospiraceae bacterium]